MAAGVYSIGKDTFSMQRDASCWHVMRLSAGAAGVYSMGSFREKRQNIWC